MPPPAILALFGPTGVGKTAVALALAELLRARGEDPVAVSVDALQVYAGLERLTAAPSQEDRARLEHRLIGELAVSERWSVAQHAARAHAEIDAARAAGRRAIVVGGTGLYLRAALSVLELRPPPAPGVREELEREAARRGLAALHLELAARAPETAARVHPHDRTRVIRALELVRAGHAPPAGGPGSRLWTAALRHPTVLAGLVLDRAVLDARLDARVEAMVAAGAREEVAAAVAAGASPTARAAIGFEELRRGDVAGAQRATRRYARRQLTWMRKLRGVELVDVGAGPRAAAQAVLARADARLEGVPGGA